MDRVVESSGSKRKAFLIAIIVTTTTALVLGISMRGSEVRASYDVQELQTTTVSTGVMDERVPVRGIITPYHTVFLDAISGGSVEKVFVQEGDLVEKGQKILSFSNINLQLDVSRTDTQIVEQINNLRNTSDELEKQRLLRKQEILETKYAIRELKRKLKQVSELRGKGYVSKDEYEQLTSELQYRKGSLLNMLELQALETKIREQRLVQITEQLQKNEANLVSARKSLGALEVRSPISGQLTALNVEMGENKAIGERLGQVDMVSKFKIEALVDEFYISRIITGLGAVMDFGGEKHQLKVTKVYPEVKDGSFRVDMEFSGDPPANLRRGQTLQIELKLGQEKETLLLVNGDYLLQSQGEWVFLLNKNGDKAHKKAIRLGRKSPDSVEVVSGLKAGDKILTFSYENLLDVESIDIEY